MIYRLYSTNPYQPNIDAATTVGVSPQISFLFAPDNTDYQNFKKQINADEAQLENADGVLMSADEAKEYVKSLP